MLLTAGAQSATVGLELAAFLFFAAGIATVVVRALWPSSRRAAQPHAPARNLWRDLIGAAAIGLYLAIAVSLVTATRYHSDAVVAAHAAAERVLAGQHPYDGFDLVAELARFGLPPEYATPLEDGTRLRSLQYPALTFLVPAPFIAAGLTDVRWLYLAEVLAIFGLTFFATAGSRAIALACCLANSVILLQFVDAGVDPLWALFALGAWLLRRSRLSALVLGLAVATRQQAWVVAPFLLVWAAQRYGAREALTRGALAVGTAVLIHLPFLVGAPLAVIRGVTDPALLPLEPWGIGPAKLAADGTGPLFPRTAYLAAAVLAYLVLLAAFATRRLRGALALPLIPLWLSWRALQSYFAFLPLFLLTDQRDD